MGPEAKLYQKIKKTFNRISFVRIENNSLLGTPDLLGYNSSGAFFTLELKVTRGKKIRFSPHQISFHVKHPKNSFILVETLDPRSSKLSQFFLFKGERILELEACGLKLDPCATGLEACGLELGA
jgi:hypothetical protein